MKFQLDINHVNLASMFDFKTLVIEEAVILECIILYLPSQFSIEVVKGCRNANSINYSIRYR